MTGITTTTATPGRGRGSATTRTGTGTTATGRTDTESRTGMRGRPGTTTSGREATTGMEEGEEVTTPAAPAGGQPRPGPRHTGGRTTEARGHAFAYTQTK